MNLQGCVSPPGEKLSITQISSNVRRCAQKCYPPQVAKKFIDDTVSLASFPGSPPCVKKKKKHDKKKHEKSSVFLASILADYDEFLT